MSILAVALVLPSLHAGTRRSIGFPGNSARVISPSGYVLIWTEAKGLMPHVLSLRCPDGETRRVLDFERHINVHWAHDWHGLAVENVYASNASSVDAFAVTKPCQVDRLEIRLPGDVQAILARFHHHFLKVERWPRDGLVLDVSGYGDSPVSIHRRLRCRPGEKSSLVCL